MSQSFIDNTLGAVILNESHRAKSISIKINHTKESVTLTYPIGFRDMAIAFLDQKREKIASIQKQRRELREANPPAEKYDQAELKTLAKKFLPQRIAEISAKTNLRYNKVTIRTARTKWGSCTSENNISLSIYLMILPQHLIDFVIIHELCHTVHHNHSPKFHALVDYICHGREKELNRELRKYSIR